MSAPAGMLDSALARAINRWNYGDAELSALAACYAFAIAENHPFNGVRFAPDPAVATAAIIALAAGDIDEDGFARWIRDNWPK